MLLTLGSEWEYSVQHVTFEALAEITTAEVRWEAGSEKRKGRGGRIFQ